jgi:hypothetical protein
VSLPRNRCVGSEMLADPTRPYEGLEGKPSFLACCWRTWHPSDIRVTLFWNAAGAWKRALGACLGAKFMTDGPPRRSMHPQADLNSLRATIHSAIESSYISVDLTDDGHSVIAIHDRMQEKMEPRGDAFIHEA